MQENLEYYSKFLTGKNNKKNINNNNKKLSTINSGEITNSLSQPEIPDVTYNLYIQQSGDCLSKEFYKNRLKQQQLKTKKKYIKNNNNNKKNKIVNELKDNNSGKLKQNPKKKKEMYEEIIRANSQSLRTNNPYLIENEYNEEEKENENEEENEEIEDEIKKFNDNELTSNNAAEINLDNEVENNRIQLEKIHKELIDNELPIIFEGINDLVGNKENTEFYFIKNKYDDILKDYM